MQYIYQSPLGPLIVTIMNDQIILVVFGQKQSGNIGGEDTVISRRMKRQLDSYFEGALKAFDLPLQYEGTPFQMKVWKYLQSIPYGKTVSYQTVAKAIGHPKSARAVGTACKRNPIPILIPCHRVIQSSGEIGEYAGGKTRKTKLLRLEQR